MISPHQNISDDNLKHLKAAALYELCAATTTSHFSLLTAFLDAQKAHPLVKEDVLFIFYAIAFRPILLSMESRGMNGQENINHYHGNGV